jgi:hypothetical protein
MLQTVENIAEERKLKLEELLSLLESEKFIEAKEYANDILNRGIAKTSINRACYDYFEREKKSNLAKAKELGNIFKDFYWNCWLSETIKTENPKKKYV